jgi:hypothetical protein
MYVILVENATEHLFVNTTISEQDVDDVMEGQSVNMRNFDIFAKIAKVARFVDINVEEHDVVLVVQTVIYYIL